MFSSTYHDSNLFPNFPSSSYPPPTLPFFIDPQNDFANNTLLIDDPLLVPFIPTTHDSPPILFPQETVANLSLTDCTAILEQDGCYGANSNYAGTGSISSIPNFLTQKPAIAKKDRHSKIHTSQGLRDRRVRLSSEIARKFFDLQDMLEFDKPSNTLEWLFTKSENAIKELARSKHNSREGEKCSCDPSSSNNKSLSGGSNKGGRKLKCSQREDVCVQTKKESRERARARARERTCYKMCNNIGKVQEFEEIRCPVTANANTQIRPTIQSTQPESCARWHQLFQLQPYPHPLLDTIVEPPTIDGFNIIEESIVIKRNMMSSSSSSSTSSHHHQNLVIPNKEPSFNNNNDYPLFPYSTTTPNWDTNGHSNFCGLATMNMNLSTCFMNQCFQMFGNSWEERAHQSEWRLIC